MHLRSFPHIYTKGDERRLAYYSVEARELREAGWVHDTGSKPKVKPPSTAEAPTSVETEQVPDAVVAPVEENQAEPIDFDAMTKRELLQYALDRGADLPENALKADLVEACKAL